MANIDNLNFKIILDDKDFDSRVKADIELAKRLNVEVSRLLDIKKQAAEATKAVAEASKAMADAAKTAAAEEKKVVDTVKDVTNEIDRQKKSVDKLDSSLGKVSNAAGKSGRLVKELKKIAASYFSIKGAARFVEELARITGEFEKQHVALRAILQDTSGADVIFEKLKSLAVMSPFSFLDLTTFAKQLSSFSVPLDEIYDTTKMLADVSAGLGVDMSRIVLAYGQIRSASFLRGTEVRQLTEAGIPILDELAKQFTEMEGKAVSVGEVFDKISARQVPFEMVEKAFKDMTSEGGKFYQMQEVLADTLAGKISNLKDSYEIMMSSIGESNNGVLKGAVNLLTSMMNNYEKIGYDLVALASTYGTYKVVVYGTTIATKGLVAANSSLIKSFQKVAASMKANPYAWAAAGVVAAVYAIYRLATAQNELAKSNENLADTVNKGNAEMDGELSMLDYLFGRLEKLKAGTAEYDEVRKELLNRYGQYLSDVDREAIAVGNLAGKYDILAESIKKASQQKTLEKGMSEITEYYNTEMTDIYKTIRNISADKVVQKQLADYIKGAVEFSDLTNAAAAVYIRNNYSETKLIAGELVETGEVGGNRIDDLREKVKALNDTISEMRQNLVSALDFISTDSGKSKTESAPVIADWEKRVSGVLDKNKGIRGIESLSTNGVDYWSYVAKMRKLYDENVKKLQDAGGLEKGNVAVENLRKQNEVIQDIFSEAFGGKVSIAKPANKAAAAKKSANEAKKAVEARIALVKEMAASYSKMKDAGIGEDTIRKKFDEVYPESDRSLYGSFDFDQTLAELEAQLNKASSSAARAAESALRKDKIDEFTSAFIESSKALEKWLDFYKEISENMPESSEDSFGVRVQRILNKLSTSNYKTGNSADKALENLKTSENAKVEAEGQDAWDQYYEEGVAAIRKWEEAAKQANRDVAQQAMQSLGKSYLDTFFSSRGIDMSNLDSKSFGQLQAMLDSLKEVDTENLIPEDVVKRAAELGVNIQPMMDFIRQTISAKENDIIGAMFGDVSAMANASHASLDDLMSSFKRIQELKTTIKFKQEHGMDTTNEEINLGEETDLASKRMRSFVVSAQVTSKALKAAAGYMQELAEATGNTRMAEVAEQVSAFAQNLGAAAQGFSQGGWIGAIVAGVEDMIDQVVSGIAQMKAYAKELEQTMKEFRHQIELNKLALKDSDYETAFGVKSIMKTMDTYEKGTEAMKKYNEYVNASMDRPEMKKKFKNLGAFLLTAPLVVDPKGLATDIHHNAYGMMSKVYTQKSLKEMEAYVKGYSKLQGMMIKTRSVNGIQKLFGAQDKYTALKDLAPEIWDENNEFNVDNAETFLKTSKQITEEQKQEIQYAIDLKKAYDDAIKTIDDQISDTFSNTASDLTDIIFDAVMNGADAWEQFREKGSEAILELGKQLMQEMMINEYLEPYQDQMRDAYKTGDIQETQERMREITANMYGGLMDLVPMLQASAEQWVEWMKREGYDPTASGGSLSDGIKSITESTADLLASYLNAIRSDVSQIRTMQAAANEKISGLLDAIPKSPTLADYLTKIEAHTANISADTRSILNQLRSVITTRGGSSAFAVYM